MHTLYLKVTFHFPLDCAVPANPANGAYVYGSTLLAAIAVLTCDEGFAPSQLTVACSATGQWSDQPSCDLIGRHTIQNKYLLHNTFHTTDKRTIRMLTLHACV